MTRELDRLLRAVALEFGACPQWQELIEAARRELDRLKGTR